MPGRRDEGFSVLRFDVFGQEIFARFPADGLSYVGMSPGSIIYRSGGGTRARKLTTGARKLVKKGTRFLVAVAGTSRHGRGAKAKI